jgi:hypothetical protein
MKDFQKLGFIYTITVLGTILLFIVIKGDWFKVNTVVEKIVVTGTVLALSTITGCFSWSSYKRTTRH